MAGQESNGFSEYKLHFTEEFKRIDDNIDKLWTEVGEIKAKSLPGLKEEILNTRAEIKDHISTEFNKIAVKLTKLDTAFNIKSGIWGLLGSMIPTIAAILFIVLRS